MQRFTSKVICFLLASLFTNMTLAEQAIMFLHGRGSSSLAQQESANSYWGDLVRATTSDFQRPTLVGHYDGTQGISVVAKTVAEEIHTFVNQHNVQDDSLTVFAHSYGGVIMRYMLSNPEMNKHFKTVLLKTKKVITLGSPHRGSEAADTALDWNENGNWFQKWLLEEYGSVNDSMRFLSTASMADVNNQCIIFGTRNCPPLPKPFFMFSGGHGADMWAVYYETMSNHDLKIATLSPFADFPETHDGVVAQYSSEGLDLNAITYHQTERNHNHLRDDEFNPEGEMLMSALLKEFL